MDGTELKYRIYPSLLDKFQAYLNVEAEYEGPFNKNAYTGEYTLSMEEMEEKLKQSLLNSINRVPYHSLAADNGTVFNELVDCLHKKRDTFRTDIEFKTFKEQGVIAARLSQKEFEDEVFLYDKEGAKSVAAFFEGSCSQLYVESTLDTALGKVLLYGFIDELKQRFVYPYCLINSKQVKEITGFEYSIIKWRTRTVKIQKGNSLYRWINPKPFYLLDGKDVPQGTDGAIEQYPDEISAKVHSYEYYQEYYDYDHKEATDKLRYIVESFIEFLEANRPLITDKKIFNQT